MKDHNTFMNETDRTIVALLWHENIVDGISNLHIPPSQSFPFYLKILDNICFADYTDRITFQNQIWQFNEMSSLIKTFHNNKIYHDFLKKIEKTPPEQKEIRFTKVLTKYSTEYNNILFIYHLCNELDMDKKDLISFFQELRLFYGTGFYNSGDKIPEIDKIFENYTINKLDIKRIYRYLEKNGGKIFVNSDEKILIDAANKYFTQYTLYKGCEADNRCALVEENPFVVYKTSTEDRIQTNLLGHFHLNKGHLNFQSIWYLTGRHGLAQWLLFVPTDHPEAVPLFHF